MLKSLILIALIGATLASHRGGTKWVLAISYSGNSCQGEPLTVGAIQIEECTYPATPTCIIDTKFTGTSSTTVCVDSLRSSMQSVTLPANYASEVVYRSFDGNNCTNIQGASYFFIYNMNKCIPSAKTQGDTWRYYDTCDANNLSSQRECSDTCGNSCQSRVTRNNTCYSLNNDFNAAYACNTFDQSILDITAKLVSPASFVTPALFVTLLLALIHYW